MPTTLKPSYGSGNQAITITLDALANGSARQATVVDNGTNLFDDVLVQLKIVSNAAGVSATGHVDVYVFATTDPTGGQYPDSLGAADAAYTLVNPTNLTLGRFINVVANSTTYISEPISIAGLFGGTMPQKWGIVVVNNSGAALGTGNTAFYQGIQSQNA